MIAFDEGSAVTSNSLPVERTTLRQKIGFYLEDIETPIGKAIAILISGFVILSCSIFVIETYPISSTLRELLDRLNIFILICFTVEYLLRLWCAKERLQYLFSFYAFLDLISILPLFLRIFDGSFTYLRILRWFRILRLIRFIEIKIAAKTHTQVNQGLAVRVLFTLFTIIFVYSGLIYQVEHPINASAFNTFLDAFYFCIVTMTTVGFGDVTPASELGRLLTLLMIATGVVLIPWQLGDLIKQFVKNANQIEIPCSGCGLSFHDADAKFCKRCGTGLER